MGTKDLFLAATLASVALGAQANETWLMQLHGSGVYAAPGTDGCSIDNPNSDECPHNVIWTGLLTIETTGSTDGSYTGSDLPNLTLTSNYYSFVSDGFGKNSFFPEPPVVTILDGAVASLHVNFSGSPFDAFSVDGLAAGYGSEPADHGFALADLTGQLASIPEPSGPLTLLTGLSALAFGTRRAKSARAR